MNGIEVEEMTLSTISSDVSLNTIYLPEFESAHDTAIFLFTFPSKLLSVSSRHSLRGSLLKIPDLYRPITSPKGNHLL